MGALVVASNTIEVHILHIDQEFHAASFVLGAATVCVGTRLEDLDSNIRRTVKEIAVNITVQRVRHKPLHAAIAAKLESDTLDWLFNTAYR